MSYLILKYNTEAKQKIYLKKCIFENFPNTENKIISKFVLDGFLFIFGSFDDFFFFFSLSTSVFRFAQDYKGAKEVLLSNVEGENGYWNVFKNL